MARVLVTGGTGFVGSRLVAALAAAGDTVRLAVRRPVAVPAGVETAAVGAIGPETDWAAALAGVDAVVHAAARVHVLNDRAADPLAEHGRVNAEGTAALAAAAAAAGVRRFVFLSSIKVMGEATGGRPWTAADPPAPVDPYGISKREGERRLAVAAAGTALSWLVLRPPLVYGPGVKGNFLSLLSLCRSPLPLPFGAIANRRSLIFVDNLVDAVRRALARPEVTGAFPVCDGPAWSTGDLVRSIRRAMGRPPGLVPVPPALLWAAAGLIGRRAMAERLLGSLEVDDTAFRTACGWQPPVAVAAGLAATVAWFERRAPAAG